MADTETTAKTRGVPWALIIGLVPLGLFIGGAFWLGLALTSGTDPQLVPSAFVGEPAPPVDLPGLAGRPNGGDATGLSGEHLGGEVMLVNYFASWCLPCLAEHPVLTRLARDEGVVIHGIASRDQPEATAAWLTRHGDPYTRVGVDLDNRAGIDWGVTGVPETFVIDAEGRVRLRFQGPVTPAVMADEIRPVLVELGALAGAGS